MAIQDAFPKREDLVIGNNDPFFDNTWDRGQLAIQAALQVAHDSDGKHPSNVMGLLQRYGVLTGAYAGDGAASRNQAALALLAAEEAADPDPQDIPDERLRLIFTCCHPALEPNVHAPTVPPPTTTTSALDDELVISGDRGID